MTQAAQTSSVLYGGRRARPAVEAALISELESLAPAARYERAARWAEDLGPQRLRTLTDGLAHLPALRALVFGAQTLALSAGAGYAPGASFERAELRSRTEPELSSLIELGELRARARELGSWRLERALAALWRERLGAGQRDPREPEHRELERRARELVRQEDTEVLADCLRLPAADALGQARAQAELIAANRSRLEQEQTSVPGELTRRGRLLLVRALFDPVLGRERLTAALTRAFLAG